MEKIIGELKNNLNEQIINIFNEYNLLKDTIDSNSKTILSLTEDNKNLKTRINELIEEKKSKSSSALWESTQVQLREKDLIIENLKKDLEFYKRNSKSNNVMEKYPYNVSTNTDTKKSEQNIQQTEKPNSTNKDNNKNDEKEVKQELEVEKELEVERELVKKVKKSKKDKSKDKSEKKKKKKKETIQEEEDDDDELEKELTRL